MKLRRKNLGVVIAAITAVTIGSAAMAGDLIWDANGVDAPTGSDGGGSWDTSSLNWYDAILGTNVSWVDGSNAIFGNFASAPVGTAVPQFVDPSVPISVQHMTFGVATDGSVYSISDFNGGSLTLTGNVTKAAGGGSVQFLLISGLTLSSGNHTFVVNDTGGDAAPEMKIDGALVGDGGVTLDNGGYVSWGTLAFNADNSYAGATTISRGRLVINTNNGLGSTSQGTTISNAGTLSIGGAGTKPLSNLTISEPITITRNLYTGGDAADGGANEHYPAAIIATNGSGTTTFNGAFVVNSTDARISSNTALVIINSNITQGPDVTAGVLSVTGDFAGYVQLNGDNTALLGGINIVSAVELIAANQNSLGGASSKLSFTGGGTLRVTNDLMQDFGTHIVNTNSFNGGVDVLTATDTFTINQNLTGGSLGKRGLGTLNIGGTNSLTTSQTYWDGGTVNVTGSTTLHSLHLRSPVVNIVAGASVTTTTGYSSFGQDNSDSATVNVMGNLTVTNQDFNISDNAGTSGVLNLFPGGTVTASGAVFLSKNNNTHATVNQTGGLFKSNTGGGNSLNIGQGNGSNGLYNKTGGNLTVAGEMWVGNAGGGNGTFIQTAGNTTIGNWWAIGRFGATGLVDLSGGTVTKSGGGQTYVGESGNTASVMNIRGNAVVNINSGEFWLGNAGGSKGTLNVSENGSLSVTSNWLAVGRNGSATGVLNMSGGSITKSGGGNFTIGSGNSTGTVTQTGGVLTANNNTYIGEGGKGIMNLSGGAANFNDVVVGMNGSSTGSLAISGTSVVTAHNITIGANNTVAGTLDLSGGKLTAALIQGGGSSGSKTVNFTGGELSVASYTLPTNLSSSGTGVLTPGGVGAVGTTAITAGYVQASTASLAIDIAGDTSFDKVTAGASSVVDGTLNVDLLGTYAPAGKFYDVLVVNSGSLTGLPVLSGPDGSLFTASIVGGNTLRLTTVLGPLFVQGDFNGDGGFDGSDVDGFVSAVLEGDTFSNFISTNDATFFATYGAHLNIDAMNILGDFNGDGGFDGSDIDGFVAAILGGRPIASVAVVPEPSAAVIALMGAPFLGRRRR